MTKFTILLLVLLKFYSILAIEVDGSANGQPLAHPIVVEVHEATKWITHTSPWTGTPEAIRTVTGETPYEQKIARYDEFNPRLANREIIDCVAFCCGDATSSPSITEPESTATELPESYVTINRPWSLSWIPDVPPGSPYWSTSTIPPSGTEPGTVIIYFYLYDDARKRREINFGSTQPYHGRPKLLGSIEKRELCQCDAVCCLGDLSCEVYVTTTQPWTGTYETTYTITPTGSEPGTVIIETPELYVTTTQPWTGTYETTYTITPTGSEPGTVIIETPESYVTTTQPWTGTYETTYTITPTGSEPGTVIIETPESYVTTTQPWTGTYETTYTITPTGSEPGTVIIETPESYVTTTQPWTGTYETTYTVPPSGTEPGAVIIETPELYVTTTQPWTGTYETTYTITPTGSEPGTVIIETPESYVTTTQPWTGTYETTYTVPPSGTEPGTVIIETPELYVTTTQPWTGTYETTYTITPTGSEPGTVIVEIPVSYVNSTQISTSTYDTTDTVLSSGVEPGTIAIETPIVYLNTSVSAFSRPWTKIDTVTQFSSCAVCSKPETITVTPENPIDTVTIIISQPQSTSQSNTPTSFKANSTSAFSRFDEDSIPVFGSYSYEITVNIDVNTEDDTTTNLNADTTIIIGSLSAIRTVAGSSSNYHASNISPTINSQKTASSVVVHSDSSATVYQFSPSNGAPWLSVQISTLLSVVGTLLAAVLL
ncbi:hypothetical protein KP2612_004219 [Komagataella phaffii]|nr:GQ67_03095T0 [Komagataella phaffii]AOA68247.1 GQ68_03079T0 [Komagataella phaffii GS115]CAH2450269.1 Hypothetical protein BQ9382_C3-6115 [Komagataella phaffii CBS 7435]